MGYFSTGRRWKYLAGFALVAAAFFSVPGERGLTPLSNEPLGRAENGRPPAPAVLRGETADEFAAAHQPEFADGALFAFAQPDHAAALDAALPAPARAVHYVRLNSEMIAGKQSPFWQAPGAGRLTVPLPDGAALSLVIDGSVMLGADRFTSTGRIEGRPHSRAIFAWSGGFLSASFEDAEFGTFALRAADGEYSQFYRLDPALILPCGGGRLPVIDAAARAAAAARRAGAVGGDGTSGDASLPGTAAAQNPQRAEVHVMMAYTPSVRSTMSGLARTNALQSDFDAAIARVNSIFDASLITARVKLVRIHETQYNEALSAGNAVQSEALTAVQSASDGKMDEIHAIRDQSGADVVCLVLGRRDTQSSGLSYILNTPGDTTNALYAYSIVEYFNIAGANVLAHELGHILGCAHDRENSRNPGSYPYSFGYRFFGADGRRYHDIMSYPPGTELSYFSNPNVVVPPPVNVPIGIAPGLPGESATALTIEQSAFEVSMFRLQTQAAPNPGHLINVATRAFVGTDDQVLIAGFVINGSQPKRMLLRAAGPALTKFGVTGVLTNPRLQIFSGQSPVVGNDDWEAQPTDGGAGEIIVAARQSGAFPFASGSADAALLVTFPAGTDAAYTAIVEGVGGTTGFALVEAYEVGREANKIVNLSTRGYADNQGREMIGGFVVEGTAGATKRILVRVLGPTLGRPPFNMTGVMQDPMMEIYNSAGELLIRNDDWSTDSRFVVGNGLDDFQPLTRYYNEQQIAATGRAPSNRREPCVLVDLPPGNYTVVAKPFELRSSNPSLDQPAQPGVGIVEVYEINP